jgi:P-type Ca2+ transporter type 2C
MAAGVLFLFYRFLPEGGTVARTVAFTSIVVFEMVRVTMIRTHYRLSVFSNLYLVGAIFLSILLQLAAVYLPIMNALFKTAPLFSRHWVTMGVVAAVIFIVGMVAARVVTKPD